MVFRILACVSFLVTACGSDDWTKHAEEVSGVPSVQESASLWTGDGTNLIVTVEPRGKTFSLFHLDPFAQVQTMGLPLAERDEVIVPSQDGQYFFAASLQNYGVVQSGGPTALNPVGMKGTIQSVAFNPVSNVAVVQDNQQDMALITLDTHGNVTGSWGTSTKFPNGQFALSGAMLPNGKYFATLSGTTVAIVDVAASVAGKAWSLTTFDVSGATSMSWAAFVPGLSFNAALIQDGTRLVTVDLDNGTLLDQESLGSATVLWTSADLSPHVLVQSQAQLPVQTNSIYAVNSSGNLTNIAFQGSSDKIVGSWLNPSTQTLSVAYNPQATINSGMDPYSGLTAERIVARFNASNGKSMDVTTLVDPVRLKLNSNYILTQYPSALGKAVRFTYGSSPTTVEVERYAFSVLSKRY